MENPFKPKLTVFHCINIFPDGDAMPLAENEGFSIKFYKLPCSSMVKDVYLLRAFEAGADAVMVFVCPEGQCRYVEGNVRAAKRVQFVKKLLDEIEIDGRRLALFNIAAGDAVAAVEIIQKTLTELLTIGPNPIKV